jgi:hypothetical protein
MSTANTVPLQNQQSIFKAVKRCQIKKVVNYKVPYFHNLSICTTFIWVVASFDKLVVILFTKSTSLI